MRKMRALIVFILLEILTIPTAQIYALPLNDSPSRSDEDCCIKMNEAVADEVRTMVEELTDFINALAEKHENFEIQLVKLNIDKHIESDNEEPSTVLELFVNDCDKVDKHNDFDNTRYNTNNAESKLNKEVSKTKTSDINSLTNTENSYKEDRVKTETKKTRKRSKTKYRVSSNMEKGTFPNELDTYNGNRRAKRKYRSLSTDQINTNVESISDSEKKTYSTYSELDKKVTDDRKQYESVTNVYEETKRTDSDASSVSKSIQEQQTKSQKEDVTSIDNVTNSETAIRTVSNEYKSDTQNLNKDDEITSTDNNIKRLTDDKSSVNNSDLSKTIEKTESESTITDNVNKSIKETSTNTETKELQTISEVDNASTYKEKTIDNVDLEQIKKTTVEQEKTVENDVKRAEYIDNSEQTIKNVNKQTKREEIQSISNAAESEVASKGNNNADENQNNQTEESKISYAENQFLKYLRTIIRKEVSAITNKPDATQKNSNTRTVNCQELNKSTDENYRNDWKPPAFNNENSYPKTFHLEIQNSEMFRELARKRGHNGPWFVYMQEGVRPRQFVFV